MVADSYNGGKPEEPLAQYPYNKDWEISKPPPKTSLAELPTPQDKTSSAFVLNLSQFFHILAFPITFYVTWTVYKNDDVIALSFDGDKFRVYLVMLSMLLQTVGSGVASMIVHTYEGWQIAPFKNPMVRPEDVTSEDIQTLRVDKYNNYWLFSIQYQILMIFQIVSMACFTMGVYGVNNNTLALMGISVAGVIAGPARPILKLARVVDGQKRAYLPVSLSMAVLLLVNIIPQRVATIALFKPAMEQWWPLASFVPASIGGTLSAFVFGHTLAASGILYEAVIAETSFNQWDHVYATATVCAGLYSYALLFGQLAAFNSGL